MDGQNLFESRAMKLLGAEFASSDPRPGVFISHSRLDKQKARAVARALEASKVDYYFDENDKELQLADEHNDHLKVWDDHDFETISRQTPIAKTRTKKRKRVQRVIRGAHPPSKHLVASSSVCVGWSSYTCDDRIFTVPNPPWAYGESGFAALNRPLAKAFRVEPRITRISRIRGKDKNRRQRRLHLVPAPESFCPPRCFLVNSINARETHELHQRKTGTISEIIRAFSRI